MTFNNAPPMNQKIILITSAVTAVIAVGLFLVSGDGLEIPISQPSIPLSTATHTESTTTEPTGQTPASAVTESTLEPEPIVAPDSVLDTLYGSLSVSAKLAAARQIAARGDESSFRSIATVLMAAEMTGEATNETLAKELAQILRQMRGPQIQAVATELAYSPSPLLSEAATDAAVASDPAMRREQLAGDTRKEVSPLSDADVQAILDTEIANKPATN